MISFRHLRKFFNSSRYYCRDCCRNLFPFKNFLSDILKNCSRTFVFKRLNLFPSHILRNSSWHFPKHFSRSISRKSFRDCWKNFTSVSFRNFFRNRFRDSLENYSRIFFKEISSQISQRVHPWNYHKILPEVSREIILVICQR